MILVNQLCVCFELVLALVAVLMPTGARADFDAGDAIALVLGLILGFLGICACIGWYAHRKGHV